jgi:hypothetical protein
MLKNQSNKNIIYKTHTNSSIETGYYQNSIRPDSISNIIKNNTIIMDSRVQNITGRIPDTSY